MSAQIGVERAQNLGITSEIDRNRGDLLQLIDLIITEALPNSLRGRVKLAAGEPVAASA